MSFFLSFFLEHIFGRLYFVLFMTRTDHSEHWALSRSLRVLYHTSASLLCCTYVWYDTLKIYLSITTQNQIYKCNIICVPPGYDTCICYPRSVKPRGEIETTGHRLAPFSRYDDDIDPLNLNRSTTKKTKKKKKFESLYIWYITYHSTEVKTPTFMSSHIIIFLTWLILLRIWLYSLHRL